MRSESNNENVITWQVFVDFDESEKENIGYDVWRPTRVAIPDRELGDTSVGEEPATRVEDHGETSIEATATDIVNNSEREGGTEISSQPPKRKKKKRKGDKIVRRPRKPLQDITHLFDHEERDHLTVTESVSPFRTWPRPSRTPSTIVSSAKAMRFL